MFQRGRIGATVYWLFPALLEPLRLSSFERLLLPLLVAPERYPQP